MDIVSYETIVNNMFEDGKESLYEKKLKKVLAGLMTWIIAFQIIPMTAY